jgi:YfiR/HmsC-like
MSGFALFAQQRTPTAYQVEAAYLYNFTKFVEWPTDSAGKNQSFTICVLGDDPFGGALDTTLAGEEIHGSKLAARRIGTAQDSADCRILFVSSSEESRLNEILAALDGASVLTVSDIRDFSRRGGMIQFVMANGRVRFEVNVKNVARAGLSVSADLLEVALAVRRDS